MTSQRDRIAVVTGGSGGIGQAVCQRLADDGCAVVINYAGHPEPAEAQVKKITGGGGRAIARVVDLPKGQRPFRVTIDPADDGSETVTRVGDLVRREFYRRIELEDLLSPALSNNSAPVTS
jgi:NAD(P)-dependent dehydrogenase (short-subunit alcohol dehydrogenase family)